MSPGVQAFLYGHYACPHTYVAQGRLDVLAAEAPLAVTWRPLAPRPDPAPDWSAITGEDGSAVGVVESLQRDAAGLGISLTLPAAPPATGAALQAAEFARDCGADEFHRFHRALFRAVFVDGVNIGVGATLLDLGASVGLDREGLAASLDDGRYVSMLREVEGEAERYEIDATPTLLLGRFKLVGAAPLELLRETLARIEAGE